MPSFTVELSEEEGRQLQESAQGRGIEPAPLIPRWGRERLVQERERAGGGGPDKSPRARRERENAD